MPIKYAEQFSFGIGLNAIYAEAKIIRKFGVVPPVNPAIAPIPASSADAVHLEGDDMGYGLNVGLMYQLDENSRFGFNYRTETDITFEGEYSNELPSTFIPGGLDGQA